MFHFRGHDQYYIKLCMNKCEDKLSCNLFPQQVINLQKLWSKTIVFWSRLNRLIYRFELGVACAKGAITDFQHVDQVLEGSYSTKKPGDDDWAAHSKAPVLGPGPKQYTCKFSFSHHNHSPNENPTHVSSHSIPPDLYPAHLWYTNSFPDNRGQLPRIYSGNII